MTLLKHFVLAALLCLLAVPTAQAGTQANMTGDWSVYGVFTNDTGRLMNDAFHGSMSVGSDGVVTYYRSFGQDGTQTDLDNASGESTMLVGTNGLISGILYADDGTDKSELLYNAPAAAAPLTGSVTDAGNFFALNWTITSVGDGSFYGVKTHQVDHSGQLADTWDVYAFGGDELMWGEVVLNSSDQFTSGTLTQAFNTSGGSPLSVTAGTLTMSAQSHITGGSITAGGTVVNIDDGQISEDGYLMIFAGITDVNQYHIFVCIRQGAPSGTTINTSMEGDWYVGDSGMEDAANLATWDDPGDTAWADSFFMNVDGNGNFTVSTDSSITGTISSDSTGALISDIPSFQQGQQHYGNQIYAFADQGSASDAGIKVGVRYNTSSSSSSGGGGGGGGCVAGPASGAGLEWLLLAGAALFGLRRSRRQ